MGLGKFKLLARAENRPPIGGVRGQRLVRPVGRALDGVVEQIEVYEVDGQLAPGQKLVEVVITEEWNDLDRSEKPVDLFRGGTSEALLFCRFA